MILPDVTATVSTKGRSDTTLPLVLTTLLTQNKKPGKIVIYDDNDSCNNPNDNHVLKNILAAIISSGIQWYWLPGGRIGQIHNHEHARKNATTDFIWRIDDDNVLLPDTLEKMYNVITSDPKIGAVGPSIVDPKNVFESKIASNKIEDIYLGQNIQWNNSSEIKHIEVDHLQGSTFMYRVKAAEHGYMLSLSKKGHREETIFTYEMVRAGWKLIAITGLITWHFHYHTGGIRSDNVMRMYQTDEAQFIQKLKEWNVKIQDYKVIHLDSGRGDHYAFKSILPDIRKKYKNHKLIISCCYPDCFWDIKDDNIILASLQDGARMINPDEHNVYKFMFERNFKQNLVEAYKKIYL